eukprot:8194684-Karenia_brevis.AAC.1
MATVEERLNAFETITRQGFDGLNKWRVTVDASLDSKETKLTEIESRVKWLVQQFEVMSHKERDGTKGLKRAFGAKGTDLKPDKFEKEKPGFTFKSWSTSVLTYVGLIEGGEEAKQMMKETIESKEPIEIQDEQR